MVVDQAIAKVHRPVADPEREQPVCAPLMSTASPQLQVKEQLGKEQYKHRLLPLLRQFRQDKDGSQLTLGMHVRSTSRCAFCPSARCMLSSRSERACTSSTAKPGTAASVFVFASESVAAGFHSSARGEATKLSGRARRDMQCSLLPTYPD